VPDASSLALFVPAALLLLVVPGPAVLYVVTQSASHGRRAGIVSMLGIETGALVHVAAAALGLSAIVASSALAFSVVRYAGAAYLVVLGVRRLLSRDDAEPGEAARGGGRTAGRLYRQGIVVNVLNPKTALFFLAFLPQFVDPGNGPAAVQMIVLGLLFVVLAVLSDGAWALAAGTAGTRLRSSRRWLRRERYVSGGVLIGLGLATAVSGSRKA
jgi:threonine/homoserine/homoserine lactone efflux protein